MKHEIWSAEEQAGRRLELFARHREWTRQIFREDGSYVVDSPRWRPPSPNERMGDDCRVRTFHAFAFYEGSADDIRLADAILDKAKFSHRYDFFVCALAQLLCRHSGRMEASVLARAEECLRACGPEQLDGAEFVGMNDNFPAMSTLILILAGERTGRAHLARAGVERLRNFSQRLDRDGAIAEFNSPTYTPITLGCMADIATYALDGEARSLALRVERQIWFDVCARFHLGSCQMGGPSSRSYTVDSCGHIHNMSYPLYTVFGPDIVFINPLDYAYGDDPRVVRHHGDPMFTASNGIWCAAPEFHIPEECGRVMTSRPDGFEVQSIASNAYLLLPDEWRVTPEGRSLDRFRRFQTLRYSPMLLTTFHTPDWSLGTASCSISSTSRPHSQRDSFFVTYRRRKPADGERLRLEDTRTVYARYVCGDAEPDTGRDLLGDQGQKTCVQKEGRAIVAYRPHEDMPREFSALRLLIAIPELFVPVDEIFLGDRLLEDAGGEAAGPEPVFVRDGNIFMAFHPLTLTDYGRSVAVRVARRRRFLTISLYNYEGPVRKLNFHREATLFTQNGFAFEIATAAETTFDKFRAAAAAAVVEDEFDKAGVRRVCFESGKGSLRIDCATLDDGGIPRAWINGKPRRAPRFEMTGGMEFLP